jgi:hypothetical protein
MQTLLQQIDFDCYRSARLLIVRTELEQLRQGRSALADDERRSKVPPRDVPRPLARCTIRSADSRSQFCPTSANRKPLNHQWAPRVR